MKKFTDENGITVDPSISEERITIYKPNGEELVTTSDPVLVGNIRYQIYQKDLKGYYAIDEEGKRHDIEKGLPFMCQWKEASQAGKIIRLQLGL